MEKSLNRGYIDRSDRQQDMIEQVVTWMSMKEEERPDFITMYVDQPDIQGHQFGPNSPQV